MRTGLVRGQKYKLTEAITMIVGIENATKIFLRPVLGEGFSLFEADFAGWENEA